MYMGTSDLLMATYTSDLVLDERLCDNAIVTRQDTDGDKSTDGRVRDGLMASRKKHDISTLDARSAL